MTERDKLTREQIEELRPDDDAPMVADVRSDHMHTLCDMALHSLALAAKFNKLHAKFPSISFCSVHRERNLDCDTCYPDINALLAEHVKVQDELRAKLPKWIQVSEELLKAIIYNVTLLEHSEYEKALQHMQAVLDKHNPLPPAPEDTTSSDTPPSSKSDPSP